MRRESKLRKMCSSVAAGIPTLLLAAALGCGGSTQPRAAAASPPAEVRHGVSEYLPLSDNTVMSFETETEGQAEHGLLIMQVRRPRPRVAELKMGGKIRRLDLLAEGVKVVDGGWLLKTPLAVGATFQGLNGPVRIESTTRSVDVPAGHFQHCLETVEIGPASRIVTTYCPLVGIVLLEVDSMSVQNPEHMTVRLKAYGQSVNLGPDQVRIESE